MSPLGTKQSRGGQWLCGPFMHRLQQQSGRPYKQEPQVPILPSGHSYRALLPLILQLGLHLPHLGRCRQLRGPDGPNVTIKFMLKYMLVC